jgi:hypothetical protein
MKHKYNTRFNPTITGPLHVGHLYMAMVNETEAHKSGGNFVVRVDDNNRYHVISLGRKLLDQLFHEYQDQLGRFMKVDVWHKESQLPDIRDIIGDDPILEFVPKSQLWKTSDIVWKDADSWVWPYSPFETLEKVVFDFWEGITLLIRGEDLITESNLYDFFERHIGLLAPAQVYLPRLLAEADIELGHNLERVDRVSNISKTLGTYTLKKQIDKFGVDDSLLFLRESCLIDPEGEFLVENIKTNPVIVGFVE